ncbi:MAG: pantoate--beta-alanine ligase [Puniceicoccaceae bacterium]
MQIIEESMQMQAVSLDLRTKGSGIGLVSTSGALHPGHGALIAKARESVDTVVVSTLVNPLEFGPNEDFQRYPRTPEKDEAFCREAGVDILFRPDAQTLFPPGFSSSVTETSVSRTLCGVSRTNYFNGVCTYHTMLLNLIRPDKLFLGQKDAQKAVVLGKFFQELHFPVEIEMVDTIREESGLACSARNTYLNDFQLRDASALYGALQEGKRLVDTGITNVDRVVAEVIHHISQHRRLRVIYVSIVEPRTMQAVRAEIVTGEALIVAAIWCDEVRLIDNILL